MKLVKKKDVVKEPPAVIQLSPEEEAKRTAEKAAAEKAKADAAAARKAQEDKTAAERKAKAAVEAQKQHAEMVGTRTALHANPNPNPNSNSNPNLNPNPNRGTRAALHACMPAGDGAIIKKVCICASLQ